MTGAGARRDPARTLAVLVPALVAAVLVPLLVRTAYRTVTTSTQGQTAPTVPRPAQLPPTPAHLLVVADAEGTATAAALLAPAPDGAGGAVVVVPLGTLATGPDGQPARLDAGTAATDEDRMAANVEGLLGITLTSHTRVTAADLVALLALLPPAELDLADDVRSLRPDGAEVVVVPAGRQALTPALAAAVLTARGDESELVRVDRAVALWRALLGSGRASTPGGTASTLAGTGAGSAPGTGLAPVLAALATGRSVARALVVTPVGAPTDEVERFTPDVVALRLLMAEVVPAAVSPAESNLRFRVRNPSGDEAVAYQVVARILAGGGSVVLVDNTVGTVPATSALVHADAALATPLAGVVAPLGPVTQALTEERIDGIDATLTVGADVVAAARRVAPTTTTVAPPTTAAVPVGTTSGAAGPSTTKKTP